jgi:ketosteroid isomerase-like protein
MPAMAPTQFHELFPEYIRNGDLDGALKLYELDCAFANREGEVKFREALREEIAAFAESRAEFRFNPHKVVQTGDLALVYNEWEVTSPQRRLVTLSKSFADRRTEPGALR